MHNLIKKQLGSVIAYFAKMPKWPRIWLVSMGLLSIFAFLIARNESSWGAVLPITLMMILCLPGSVLVLYWANYGDKLLEIPNDSIIRTLVVGSGPYAYLEVVWHIVVLFTVGYLQWFVIFPALKKMTERGPD